MATITETKVVGEAKAPVSLISEPAAEPPNSHIDLIEKIHHIPQFTDKYAERQWAKEHMAAAFRVFAKLGYNDGAGGHISLRDPVQSDCFWISEFCCAFLSSIMLTCHE